MRRISHALAAVTSAAAILVSSFAPTGAQADGTQDGPVGRDDVSNSSMLAGTQPVILVHGWSGDSWNWAYFQDHLAQDGFTDVRAWDYDHTQDNVVTARELSAYVDRVLAETGAATVDLVTHSMGGLGSRYYLRNLGGADKVDDWVSIGGPNHGTNTAYGCFDRSCVDMRPGSAFLTALNAGDETPGPVDYTTFWSPCDEVINPDRSVTLEGATNHQTACVGHVSLLAHAPTYQGTRDAIR